MAALPKSTTCKRDFNALSLFFCSSRIYERVWVFAWSAGIIDGVNGAIKCNVSLLFVFLFPGSAQRNPHKSARSCVNLSPLSVALVSRAALSAINGKSNDRELAVRPRRAD